ncbi:MAG: hypothetical protein FWD65_06850 [Coriobacteriia bacterium]|nr:hypothetical protein [Coriobacteriia bacterium]
MGFQAKAQGSATRLVAGALAFFFLMSVGGGVCPALAPAAPAASAGAAMPAASGASSEVVLILAPFVTWDDISAQKTPALWGAAQQGLIGNINARSLVESGAGSGAGGAGAGASGAGAGASFGDISSTTANSSSNSTGVSTDSTGPASVRSQMTERALTLGAGAPVLVDPAALGATDWDEMVSDLGAEGSAAGFYPYLPSLPEDSAIAYDGLPDILKANAANKYDATPGLLGQTIRDAGGVTAALGNSDPGRSAPDAANIRPAALVAMNQEGLVRYGTIAQSLLADDLGAPFGVRSDAAKLAQAMHDTARDITASKASKSLVVIDPGDLYRACAASAEVAPAQASRQWADALTGLDSCYRQAREIWPQATIIVTSLATRDRTLDSDSFGPVIVSPGASSGVSPGAGAVSPTASAPAPAPASSGPGLLTSASTHRAGLLTDNDLAPSILEMLGIKVPVKMIGSPLTDAPARAKAAPALSALVTQLKRTCATAVSVDMMRSAAITWFVIGTVVVILLGAALGFCADRVLSPRMVRVSKRLMYAVILFVLSLPVANWLMFFIYRWPATPAAVIGEFLGVAAVLWAALCLIAWKGSKRLPLIVLIALTATVIIVDQFLGAPASFTSLFGYSPIGASRYYGMGNEAAAILVSALMIGCGLLADQYADARWVTHFKRYGVAALGLLSLVVAAAPQLGANAGVAIWATIGFMVLWILLNAKRITWKSVLVMIGAVVAMVALLVLADLFLPGGGTHLGRLVIDMTQGGVSQLWALIARKVAMNLRTFNYIWSYLLLAIVVYLIVVAVRPAGGFAETMKSNGAYRKAMISVLITGILAFCTEDSGVTMPSLMVVYLGTSIVWLMLGPVQGITKEQRLARRRRASLPQATAVLVGAESVQAESEEQSQCHK